MTTAKLILLIKVYYDVRTCQAYHETFERQCHDFGNDNTTASRTSNHSRIMELHGSKKEKDNGPGDVFRLI